MANNPPGVGHPPGFDLAREPIEAAAKRAAELFVLIERGLEQTIIQKKVTYDLARQMTGATELKTSEFADAIIRNM